MLTYDTLLHAAPLLIAWWLFAAIAYEIGKSKGVSLSTAILGTFPLWVAVYAIWLIRQPDVNGDGSGD